MNIVVLDGFMPNFDRHPWTFEQEHTVQWYDFTEVEKVNERIQDADAVFINRMPFTRENIEHAPNLKYIGTLSTGFNMIDLAAAKEKNITVCNVPGYSTHSVTQTTFAMLLEMTTKISTFNDYVKDGGWKGTSDPNIAAIGMTEIYGKTLGILGCGEIGMNVANIAQAFGMNVLAYRRTPDHSLNTDTFRFVSLEEMLKACDILTIHCPLNAQTENLINKETIAMMKDGISIINTARGAVINEIDVVQALNNGKIKMIAVDVLRVEPPEYNNQMIFHKNCIVTPHIAWMPKETRIRLLKIAAENLDCFLAGKPQNVVQ